jgi:chemotaxis protein histidine kinase CheA
MRNKPREQNISEIFAKEAMGLIGTMKQELTRWDRAQNGVERARQWRELFRCAHILKSTSGSMGFKQLEELSTLLCEIFQVAKAKNLELSNDMLSLLIAAVDMCMPVLEGTKAGRYKTFLNQLKSLYEKIDQAAET